MGISKFTQEIKREIADKYKRERMSLCCAENTAFPEVICTRLLS